ncbi:diaminopimelate epimerase [Bounagaea algeriensis]
MQSQQGPAFVKGHGTENDFVLLPDPDDELDLTEQRVRALCDRRSGIGADGVLRVVRASEVADAPQDVGGHSWFMDYRNADGSLAEMCGNGVRVFARYLVTAGYAAPGEISVGTRAGMRPVVVHDDGRVSVDMGLAKVFDRSAATLGAVTCPGLAIDVGNPHLACVLDDWVSTLDLSTGPEYDPGVFPRGVNVEFVERISTEEIRMRVYERGVGETRSCGTGTVAATVAALHADGEGAGERTVHVPGGTVRVTVTAEAAVLTGSAVLVAEGRVTPALWSAAPQR